MRWLHEVGAGVRAGRVEAGGGDVDDVTDDVGARARTFG